MDREKIIKGLEAHGVGKSMWVICANCPYNDGQDANKKIDKCTRNIMIDVLELLREQEAVKPRVSSVEQRCGNCNKVIEMDGWVSCPWCGKQIDWEGWWSENARQGEGYQRVGTMHKYLAGRLFDALSV